MVRLVRNGYIGKLEHIDLWCRDFKCRRPGSYDFDPGYIIHNDFDTKPYIFNPLGLVN